MNNVNVLKDVVAVNLRFSTWTGRKTLDVSDLSLAGEAPPKEIVNLGSKHTTDPQALKVFNTLKRRAERVCLKVGVPFMGGYAIPTNKANEIAKELNDIAVIYEQEKRQYLIKHNQIQSDWVEKFPDYKHILLKAITPVDKVEKQISAGFSMYHLESAQGAITDVNVGLGKETTEISNSLESEVQKSARKLLDSLSSSIKPSTANVKSIAKLRERVEGLAFLDNKFKVLAKNIKRIEAQMPISGPLSTEDVNNLSGLLYRMSSEDKLQVLMTNVNSELSLEETSNTEPEEISSIGKAVTFDFGTQEAPKEKAQPTFYF